MKRVRRSEGWREKKDVRRLAFVRMRTCGRGAMISKDGTLYTEAPSKIGDGKGRNGKR